MEAINTLNFQSLEDTFVSLATAFLLGSLIGFERQYRQRTAGLRTNALVSIGAAAFVDMANRLTGHDGAVHATAYVISGIGFLGAGVIMKGDAGVRGLNTAATLWGAAAVGACAGADLIAEAVVVALFVLAGNTLLRPLVNVINRQPIDDAMSEVTYTVCVIGYRLAQKQIIHRLEELLKLADYPAGKIEVRPFAQGEVQVFATLVATSAESEALDQVVDEISREHQVSQAFWSISTTD